MPTPRSVLAVAALATIPFLGTLGHGFTYDDPLNLQNPSVREHRFGALWTEPFHSGGAVRSGTGAWRPVVTTSFAANDLLGRDRPALWHGANVALHAGAAIALLFAAAALSIPAVPAFVAASLFAVHPIHTEVVANVSNRTESLHALFFLAALAVYARSRERGRAALGALILLAAALLSKETAVAFVPVACALEWSAPRRPGSIRRLAGVGAVVAAYLLARLVVLGSVASSAAAEITRYENPVVAASGIDRPGTALGALARGAGLLFWPHPLTPDYGYADTVPGFGVAGIVGLMLVLAALVSWGTLAVRRSPALVPLTLLLAPWLVVANLLVPIGTIFGERLLYLPSAGLLLLLAPWLRTRAAIGALLVVGGVASAWSASAWRNDFTLFSRAEKAAPDSVRVLVNLGGELLLRGDGEGAERRLRRAVELAPDLAPARINLGAALLRRGDREGAVLQAARALDLDPGSEPARRLLDAASRSTP